MSFRTFWKSKSNSRTRQALTLGRRRLGVESLEGRQMMAVLGIDPGFPLIAYNSTGTVNYDPNTTNFDLAATPLAFLEADGADPVPFQLPAAVAIQIQVDTAGNLIGGVPGNDLVVTGTIDDGGAINYSGVLLTGEITAFGYADSGSTDAYDFRFTVTGGALAAYFAGKDIGVTTTSENSTFTGSFAEVFSGGAKGNIGTLDELVGSLSGHKFKDKTGNGVSPDDTPLGGVTIELLRDVDGNGQYNPAIDGPVLATTVTAAGTGFYSFENLQPGNYIVREQVPPGFQQTAPAAGFYAVTVVAGTVTEDLDFANEKKRDCNPPPCKPKPCDPPKPSKPCNDKGWNDDWCDPKSNQGKGNQNNGKPTNNNQNTGNQNNNCNQGNSWNQGSSNNGKSNNSNSYNNNSKNNNSKQSNNGRR
ncbi:MAG: hypothetical protein JNG90_07520 [Planctomycetaceae bacterium]|nr:hypothetical protein [Planctomycetaceae bacterium]